MALQNTKSSDQNRTEAGGERNSRNVIPFLCDPHWAYADDWLQILRDTMPEENIAFLADVDVDTRQKCKVAIVANPRVDDVRQLPNLRWVQSLWAGVERLMADLPDAKFDVVRLVDPQLAAIMAEAVLAWTLYLHRDMPMYAAQQRRSEWKVRSYRRAHDVTVGILGLGELGEPAARRLLDAGFNVRGWSRSKKNVDGVETFDGLDSLPAMLSGCDIVVCLLPLTPQTRGLLDARHFASLPKGAAVINFARGPLIDDEALRAALDSEHVRHAVLDVFNVEPLPAESWHWQHPGVTVLPHISGPNDRASAAKIVADNISAYREIGELPVTVDRSRGY